MVCQLAIQDDGPAVCLGIIGKISMCDLPSLHDQIREVVADSVHRGVIIDLEGVDFINSTVLGFLVSAMKTLRSRDQTLALVGANATCLETLRVTNLNRILPIYESRDEARRAMGD